MKDDTLHSAFQHWEELSSTKEQRIAYEGRARQIMDEEAARREAELEKKEAREKGWLEGRKEGEEKGEKKAKEAIARKFLALGMDINDVAKGTELDVETVKRIQREMNNDL